MMAKHEAQFKKPSPYTRQRPQYESLV